LFGDTFYETHEGLENALFEKGLIKEGELSEFSYYDAKTKIKNEIRYEVYSENLFESRGEGALQLLRSKDFKFIL